MGDIIDFKRPKVEYEEELINLSITVDQDGGYGVFAEIAEWADDGQVFEALMAATMKFATEASIGAEITKEEALEIILDEEDTTLH